MSPEPEGLGRFLLIKLACCGGPLLVLAVVSGALALVDAALGVAAIGLVVLAVVLYQRQRGSTCDVPERPDGIAGVESTRRDSETAPPRT